MAATLFAQAGGARKVRAVTDALVGRMVGDVLIGFFFATTDPDRLRELEYQHAARALGAPVAYTGRPIAAAHGALPIRAGHFARRLRLLAEALAEAAIPAPVAQAWLAHQARLRAAVVRPTAPPRAP